MIYNVKVNEKAFKLEVTEESKSLQVKIDGRTIRLDNYRAGADSIVKFLQDNQPFELEIAKNDTAYECWHRSRSARCEVISEKAAKYSRLMGGNSGSGRVKILKAPMPGLVVKSLVAPGQKVNKGDGIIIIEAMKMENELKAMYPGVIKAIKAKDGQTVDKNQVLVEFE